MTANAPGGADGGQVRVDVAKLVELHHAELYRYAYRLTGSTADAEDLTQQAFLIAQSKLEQVRDAACARSWLFAIVRNTYLKELRQRPLVQLREFDLDYLPVPAAEDEIDREKLQSAIGELPDEFKLVLLAFYFEDCSYREIAERFQLPLGTVMSRLSRAKSHLRARLFASKLARSASG